MDTFSIRPGDKFQVGEEDKAPLREVLPYWQERSLRDAWKARLPEEVRAAALNGVIANENYSMSGPGHLVPDYQKLLRLGLRGIKEEIEVYGARKGDPRKRNGISPGGLDCL
jgi:formate C-acetyltransferase